MILLYIVSVLVILVLEHITKNIYFSRHQPNKNFLSRHKFSPHLLSWAPKVEGHSFAGEVINMSSMKLGIRQTAQNTPLTTFWLAFPSYKLLSCTAATPGSSPRKGWRIAPLGAVSLPCNNRSGNEVSILGTYSLVPRPSITLRGGRPAW